MTVEKIRLRPLGYFKHGWFWGTLIGGLGLPLGLHLWASTVRGDLLAVAVTNAGCFVFYWFFQGGRKGAKTSE